MDLGANIRKRSLLVIIAVMFFSMISPVASANTTSEGEAFFNDINDKYYSAIFLRDCFVQSNPRAVDEADAGNYAKWLNGSITDRDKYGVYIGRTLKPDNGWAQCRDTSIISKAVSALKYSNGVEVLTNLGYHKETKTVTRQKQNCTTTSYETCTEQVPGATVYVLNAGQSGDVNRAFNSRGEAQVAAAKYFAYDKIFASKCSVSETITGKGAKGVQTKIVEEPAGSKSYTTQDVEVEFKFIETQTNSTRGSSSPVVTQTDSIKIDKFDYNGQNTTCRGLLELMNKLAPSVSSFNNDNPGVAITTSATAGLGDNVSTDAKTTSTCSPDIGGVGWIVCPVMTFIGSIADGAYAGIKGFVETKPELLTHKNTVAAWEMFRNIANVMFVIVFLIIVFSQVTSVGITNYGIKKMLPRLIIGAIMVNMSLIICQLAVDISNILGGSIIALFNSAGAGIGLETNTPQNGFLVFIGWVLAGTGLAVGIVILTLAVSVPVIIAAALSLLMTFVILILRNAAILMLTVIAPLAFVAYLLPNTENLFKKWSKMFYTLLLVFPIISLLFGAGKLASLILGTNPDWGMQLASLGAASVPLILLPSVVKGAMKSTGTLGAKLSSYGDKANGNVGKKVGDTKLGQINKHRKQEALARRAKIQGGTYSGINPLSKLTSGVNRRINNSKLSGRWGNRQAAEGASVVASQDAEDMKHAVARLDSLVDGDVPLTSDELVEIAMGKDVTTSSGQVIKASSLDGHTRRAAMEKVAPIATVDQAHKLVAAATAKDATGKNIMGASERKTLSQALSKSSIATKAPYMGGKTLGDIEAGNVDLTSAALASIGAGKITPEALAGMDANALRHLVTSAKTTPAGSRERIALMEAYNEIYKPGSQLASRVTKGTDHETALADIITL